MSCIMGGVIGEGKVGGKELNVRNKGGSMLWKDEMENNPLMHSGGHTLRVCAATCLAYRCYPNRLLILGHRGPMGDFNRRVVGGGGSNTLG
jgi:hypothetical protein